MTHDAEFVPAVAVAQFSGDLGGMDADSANDLFVSLLSDISRDCVKTEGAVIGHNKANFKCGSDMLSISCTTEDGNVRSKVRFSGPVGRYTGVMNIIVYGAEYAGLKAAIEKRTALIEGCSVAVLKDGGCDDPECHDPNCNDPNHRHGGSFIKLE